MSKLKKTLTNTYFDQFRQLSYSAVEKVRSDKKAITFADSSLAKLHSLIAQAEQKADKIIEIVPEIDVSSPIPFPIESFTVDALTMMCLVKKIESKVVDTAINLLSHKQAENGRKRKRDILQLMIDLIVIQKKDISEKELLDVLESKRGLGIIEDIDTDCDLDEENKKKYIHYFDPLRDKTKKSSISGLKDRLSRAKKQISLLSA